MVNRKSVAGRERGAPAPGVGKRGPSGHMAYLLRQASAAVRLDLEREFAEYSVTLPQFSVMTMIAAYPPLSGAELARLTLLTPQTVNVIVRNLVKRGFLVQEPDAVHGRILRLLITDKGKDVLSRCRKRADKIEAQLVSDLSQEGESVIRAWLSKVAQEHLKIRT